jgi:hypothetical protein
LVHPYSMRFGDHLLLFSKNVRRGFRLQLEL